MQTFSSADEANKANFLNNYIVNNISGRFSWSSETSHVKKNLFSLCEVSVYFAECKILLYTLQEGRRHALLYRHKCRIRHFEKEKQLKFCMESVLRG